MPVLPILRLGHPALRSPAAPVPLVEIGQPGFQAFLDDLVDTMHDANGVGLAAPQVGIGRQVFVYEAAGDSRADGLAIPLHVVINPMLTPQSHDQVYDWEGCLSIPDLRGLVPRHAAVRVRGLDRHGQPLDYAASGFEARIVQHEFDHLNGVVFLDRMRDLKSLAFLEEWEEHMLRGDKDEADEVGVG